MARVGWPADGRRQEYLDIAAALRPLLDQIDGFISIERFESLHEPGKILSLSFFGMRRPLQNGGHSNNTAARR